MDNAPEVSVIIPCLDEAACAASYGDTLLPRLGQALPSHEVIFSDGGSCDGTLDHLWRLAGSWPGVAALAGGRYTFRASLERAVAAARGRYVLFMEADLSFDPADAGRLLAEIKRTGADCVCGSPFLGGFSGLPLPRRALTWGANALLRLRFGRQVTSYTQIFKLYRAEKLKALRFETEGFALDAELLIKFLRRGWKVAEIPVVMRARGAGRSKLSAPRETANCLKLLLRSDYTT
ncbi:MAG: glycosyltransferase [Elusimicrobiales bacterium]|nr:glycosyltransferase [Elusimicrobiales bacterium]